jgi:hypothetical protein
MGAWKLRAIVYGFLAVIAALVLHQRGVFAADPRTLEGMTEQRAVVEMTVRGSRVAAFTVDWIDGRCQNGAPLRYTWWPVSDQGNVTYRRDGDWFLLHERPDPRYPGANGWRSHLYMHARISPDERRVSGQVWYSATKARHRCFSEPVPFSVSAL